MKLCQKQKTWLKKMLLVGLEEYRKLNELRDKYQNKM